MPDDDEAPSAPDVKRRRGRSPEVIDLDSISPLKADDASSLIGSFAYSGAHTAGPSSAAAAAAPEPIEWLTKRRNQSEEERAAISRTAKLALGKTRRRAGGGGRGGGGGGGGGTRSAGKRPGGRGGSSGRGGAAARKRRRSVWDSEDEDEEEEEEAEESDESWNSEAEAAAEAAEAAEIEDEIEDDEIEVSEIEVCGAREASRAVPNTAAAGAAAAGRGGRRLIKTADVRKGRVATGRAQAAPSGANPRSNGHRKERAIIIDSDEEDEEEEDEEDEEEEKEEDEGMDDGDGEEEVGFEDGERGRPPETEAEARAVVSRSLSACEAESRQISSALAAIAPAAAASTTAEDEVGAQDGALHLTKGGDGRPLRVQPTSLGGSARMMLKEYQLVGLNWLWLMWRMRAGGILADEMGLGKTIQVIALICAIKEAQSAQSGFGGGHDDGADDGARDGADDGARRCHLVVAPASTLDNWLREFGLWAPSLVVAKYHGSQALRTQMQRDLDDSTFDVLVLPYTYFEGEGAASQYDRRWLRRRRWGLGVFDEAHALKTSGSARYHRLSQLTIAHRLLLSGTPVQNNLHELLTLLSFMLPRAFPPRLADAFAVLDKARRDRSSAQDGARGGGRGGGGGGGGGGRQAARDPDAVAIAKARRLLAPFVLRRRKSEVVTHLLSSLMTSDGL
jgi:hypothetical protein